MAVAWTVTATAVVGTVVAVLGNTGAALFIWIAGGVLSASIVFSAPWLLHFFATDGSDDDESI